MLQLSTGVMRLLCLVERRGGGGGGGGCDFGHQLQEIILSVMEVKWVKEEKLITNVDKKALALCCELVFSTYELPWISGSSEGYAPCS